MIQFLAGCSDILAGQTRLFQEQWNFDIEKGVFLLVG